MAILALCLLVRDDLRWWRWRCLWALVGVVFVLDLVLDAGVLSTLRIGAVVGRCFLRTLCESVVAGSCLEVDMGERQVTVALVLVLVLARWERRLLGWCLDLVRCLVGTLVHGLLSTLRTGAVLGAVVGAAVGAAVGAGVGAVLGAGVGFAVGVVWGQLGCEVGQ